MSEWKPIPRRQFPKLPGLRTEESIYWRKYRFPVLVKETGAVTSINFSPVRPHDFAVTSGMRVQIYSQSNQAVRRSISRFGDVAYSGSYRRDGSLLVAGSEDASVQVFHTQTRVILRTYKAHLGPVRATAFASDNVTVISASDDRTVKLWDLSADEPKQEFTTTDDGHSDYIRTMVPNLDNPNLFLTGSYDHTVKLWDARTAGAVMTMEHGAPVECVRLFPGGSVALSAGGDHWTAWDMAAGGRAIHQVRAHKKTVTGLAFDPDYTRILSCSLDHTVKIHDVRDYSVTHSVVYPAPLLSVALSPDNTHLVAGMANGLLSIRHRATAASLASGRAVAPVPAATAAAEATTQAAIVNDGKRSARPPASGSYRFFVRGRGHQPGANDFTVESRRRPRLQPFERLLKNYEYQAALDLVLSPDYSQRLEKLRREHSSQYGQPSNKPFPNQASPASPLVVISLLEELVQRSALQQTLLNRSDTDLLPLFQFIIRHIDNPRYSSLLIDVASMLLDLYDINAGKSTLLDDMLVRLSSRVAAELQTQRRLFSLIGSLDMLFAAASTSTTGHIVPAGRPEAPMLQPDVSARGFPARSGPSGVDSVPVISPANLPNTSN
ncbi:hypothetical protein H696_04480 [Fonticula alba]|uniref:U3 small nucleolar RNA-associated protein 15 C-terminal domain-containing protein n=1 Tax=Fonticula alba TaxID=691883 RepID=A0A058Z484_FONAL|nr:hypothetical protein H696_04480 [Fonticula alba]KCV69060.1 hypothetical protein H696_04480 [Fonticula alba]|eukprot:XP_009496631.1 hypothetical protein H696_04480 [Fonticula alba]